MSYTRRVKVGETRELPDAVATRVVRSVRLPEEIHPGRDDEVPFPEAEFHVVITRYLAWSEKGFASYGYVRGRRKLGPNATWAEIEEEAYKLNRIGIRCFGDTNHRLFEGGGLFKDAFYTGFGS